MNKITVDVNNLTKSSYNYNLKNVDTVNIKNLPEDWIYYISGVSLNNFTLQITLINKAKITISNISNPEEINFIIDMVDGTRYTETFQDIYDTYIQ